jgi:hypothetical protein
MLPRLTKISPCFLPRSAVASWTAPTTSGGANTSVERNNVYGIEPRVYLQDGREVNDATGKPKIDPATLIIGTVAIAIVAVAVRALCGAACVYVGRRNTFAHAC